MHLIVYLTDTFGRRTENGTEVYLPPDLFKFYINMDQQDFKKCLQDLEAAKILKLLRQDHYILTNRTLLMQKLPRIVDQVPTFSVI